VEVATGACGLNATGKSQRKPYLRLTSGLREDPHAVGADEVRHGRPVRPVDGDVEVRHPYPLLDEDDPRGFPQQGRRTRPCRKKQHPARLPTGEGAAPTAGVAAVASGDLGALSGDAGSVRNDVLLQRSDEAGLRVTEPHRRLTRPAAARAQCVDLGPSALRIRLGH
jgi:hypothetical protein